MTRRGMTILEVTVSVLILSVIAAVLAPIANAAADSYAAASAARNATERASFSIDRVVRFLRETPEGANPFEAGIVVAQVDAIELTDGSRIELSGSDLQITSAGGLVTRALCRDVDTFEITYLGADGVTDTSLTPALTTRCYVTISTGGLELRSSVFIRVTMGAS